MQDMSSVMPDSKGVCQSAKQRHPTHWTLLWVYCHRRVKGDIGPCHLESFRSFPKMEEIGLRFCYGLETLGLFHSVNYPFSSVLTKPPYYLGKSTPRLSMTDIVGTLWEFYPPVFIQHLISIYWMVLGVWNILSYGFEIPLAIGDCNFLS